MMDGMYSGDIAGPVKLPSSPYRDVKLRRTI